MTDWSEHVIALTEEDAQDMFALEQAVLADLPDPRWYYPSTAQEFAAQARAGHAWGIRMGGRLIALNIIMRCSEAHDGGYAAKLGRSDVNSMNFEDIMVDSSWRRQGIHSFFITRSIEQARAWGCPAIYATVDPDNLPSLRAFEKHGFRIVAQMDTYDGRPRCFLRLE